MSFTVNAYGQPVGMPVPPRTYAPPYTGVLEGSYSRLEHVNATQHADDLFENVYGPTCEPRVFTYMPSDRFQEKETFGAYVRHMETSKDPYFFVVRDKDKEGRVAGTLSLSSMDLKNGIAEIAWVTFSPGLQRTRAATESHYLLGHYVMEQLHYRRLQWKCDALNAPSRAAAQRLGFQFEGIFRNAILVKGRNRDTAWYSITDAEWSSTVGPSLRRWLSADNFDEKGQQKLSLSEVRNGKTGKTASHL